MRPGNGTNGIGINREVVALAEKATKSGRLRDVAAAYSAKKRAAARSH
jgi:hypothetical protein